jgi:hypothetical protein
MSDRLDLPETALAVIVVDIHGANAASLRLFPSEDTATVDARQSDEHVAARRG